MRNAKKQHQLWMDTLKEALTNNQIYPLQLNANRCGFGHFYNSLIIQDEEIIPLWNKIDGYHHKLHNAGKDTLIHIKNENIEEAKKAYKAAKEKSEKVFRLLDEMIDKLKK